MVDTNSFSYGYSMFLPVNEAVGAMVFPPKDSSVPVPNPVMVRGSVCVQTIGFKAL